MMVLQAPSDLQADARTSKERDGAQRDRLPPRARP